MKTTETTLAERASQKRLDSLLQKLAVRGTDDSITDVDDYCALAQQYETRELIVLELYDEWICPPRHEHELQILREVVTAVTESRVALFAAGAATGGVIGNASYDVLKRLLGSVCTAFRNRKRGDAFKRMRGAIVDIESYFSDRDEASEHEILGAVDITAAELRPLLRLLGFRCRRRKKSSIWRRGT